jgi:hypothetical protein
VDTAHARRGKYDHLRLLSGKEGIHIRLAKQIQLTAAAGQKVGESLTLKAPHHGGSNHSPVAGYVDLFSPVHWRGGFIDYENY